MNKTLSALSASILMASLAMAGGIEREIEVRSGGLLEFDLDAGGDIEISAWGREAVEVTAAVSGRDADDIEVKVEPTSGGVLVTSDYTASRRSTSSSIDFTVRVPALFDIEIKSNGGAVSIQGVEGEISGKTMGGKLTLKDLKGTLRLTTMGGAVTLTDSDVDGRVKTMGGEVLVEDVFGDVDVSSMGGGVVHRRVTRRDGSFSGDQVQISSMGGDIDVAEAPAGADVHTMGGDITIASASEFVKAKTMGGDIRISDVDGWIKATTMAGDVDVELIGGHDVELTSMSGEITLTVPDGAGFDIDIELEYTKTSGRNYKIISDFPVSEEVSEDWEYGHGTPRKTIHASGVVDGGGSRVVIHAINGNVHLKRGR